MDSRAMIDRLGMPLELDTDGIWTLLPKGFPEDYKFILKNGKKVGLDFPCTMCNLLIYDKYGNKQYQTLTDKKTLTYETRMEMSIFFEIDGPYKCMMIPASKEENKMLKKRYAVFNHAGKMTEVKGFELKRRGEL
jgi:DNA polymerase epsilon subunit 1